MLQEFKRTRGNINSSRERAELLISVRNDINEYKVGVLFYHSSIRIYAVTVMRFKCYGFRRQVVHPLDRVYLEKGQLFTVISIR
jgi:hypothetical protein